MRRLLGQTDSLTQKERENKVEYFVSEVVQGGLTVDRSRKFENALYAVLNKIWDKIEERSDEILLIIFADVCSLFPLYLDEYVGKKKWVFYFPDTLADESNEEIEFIIAHEFAHFMLGHNDPHAPLKVTEEDHEEAADVLAKEWGFRGSRKFGRE